MLAYKFLDAEGRAPFTWTRWPVGEWVEAPGVRPCHQGIHACRSRDLAYWLAASLWEIELDEPIVETRHKLTARRGRLVAPVAGYPEAVFELGRVSAWRARDRAVEALAAAPRVAELFAAATTLEALAALGHDVDDSTGPGTAAALAADAARLALRGPVTEAPFIGACSAGHAAAGMDGEQRVFDEGFAAERAAQSGWLVEQLGLAGDRS